MSDLPAVSFALGGLAARVESRLRAWDEAGFSARLWRSDHTLWSEEDIPELADRLGWLRLPARTGRLSEIENFAAEIRPEADRVVLLGMGGSSLAPEVYQSVFGNRGGHPELAVLDSTHPAAVRAAVERTDPRRTFFLVASKSGGTIETLSLFRCFWQELAAEMDNPGDRFAALTDPGSGLEALAGERGFRRIFSTPPDVGGRYSALTAFGLVPAALIGMDIRRLMDSAAAMADACGPEAAPSRNPGLRLGAALGEAVLAGRDKATYVCSPALSGFGDWVEQLIAESTGKNGTGIIPVVGEPLGGYEVYGNDRVFIHLALAGDDPAGQPAALEALQAAGHPVIRVILDDLYSLGAELFRSETAVAAAGAVLGINPFDQPDVQLAKDLARRAMSEEGSDGALDETAASDSGELERRMGEWAGSIRPGDYVSIHAYLPAGGPADPMLEELRLALRDRFRVAVTLGYGPRFLHSTGQLHKGGAGNGVFLQIVDDPRSGPDPAVPEARITFGELIEGQAAGDFQALAAKGRRVLRVRLDDGPEAGAAAVLTALDAAGRRPPGRRS